MKEDHLSDLPLSGYNRSATVIAFPLARRMGKVRRVCEVIRGAKSDRAAHAYVAQIERNFKAQLVGSGVNPKSVHAELDAFWDEVQAELTRLG